MIQKALAVLTAMALTAAPAFAASNPAASLSVVKSVRVGTPSTKTNDLTGSGIFFAAAAAVILIVGIVVLVNDDDDPDSN